MEKNSISETPRQRKEETLIRIGSHEVRWGAVTQDQLSRCHELQREGVRPVCTLCGLPYFARADGEGMLSLCCMPGTTLLHRPPCGGGGNGRRRRPAVIEYADGTSEVNFCLVPPQPKPTCIRVGAEVSLSRRSGGGRASMTAEALLRYLWEAATLNHWSAKRAPAFFARPYLEPATQLTSCLMRIGLADGRSLADVTVIPDDHSRVIIGTEPLLVIGKLAEPPLARADGTFEIKLLYVTEPVRVSGEQARYLRRKFATMKRFDADWWAAITASRDGDGHVEGMTLGLLPTTEHAIPILAPDEGTAARELVVAGRSFIKPIRHVPAAGEPFWDFVMSDCEDVAIEVVARASKREEARLAEKRLRSGKRVYEWRVRYEGVLEFIKRLPPSK